VPWILRNGLHCRNSPQQDPNFTRIGNSDLIEKRRTWKVPLPPGGTLADYVPFYFTPHSMMLFQIQTGYNGVPCVPPSELVFLTARLPALIADAQTVLTTDRHAMLKTARFFTGLDGLSDLPWDLYATKNFQRDPEHPERVDRYQAEALVHGALPSRLFAGLVCHNEQIATSLREEVAEAGLSLEVVVRSNFYF
jgi:hypothetical protein